MNKKIQSIIAILLTISGISFASLVAYFSFIFPRTIAVWAQQNKTLSSGEMFMAELSNICRNFGLILLPFFLLMTMAGFIWMIVALTDKKAEI